MNVKNKGLGRGLDAIFELEGKNARKTYTAASFEEIELESIKPNPKQPRTNFGEDALSELADSIRSLGVIQPITVKRQNDGEYVIISGERRWRAAQMAGLSSIPAFLREADDQGIHEMALVENIQREDLNPMEIALGLQRLIDECSLTQDKLSERVGKKRSTIANYMRLLKLPAEIQSAVSEGYITMGHAKAIASAPDEMQLPLLRKTVRKGLSVRQLEEAVKKLSENGTHDTEEDGEYPETYGRLVEQLERFFTQNISIRKGRKGGGRIVIGFENDNEIERFITNFEQFGITDSI